MQEFENQEEEGLANEQQGYGDEQVRLALLQRALPFLHTGLICIVFCAGRGRE